MKRVLISGISGFIGSYLAKYLTQKGYWVRGIDITKPIFEPLAIQELYLGDLRNPEDAIKATKNVEEIYMLAADMGGIGFISGNFAQILRNNLLINLNTLEAARINDIKKVFFASSACIYPKYKQKEVNVAPLKEDDDMPADPDEAYGWEKLTTEKLCQYYKDYGIEIRIARFHNVYGPNGVYEGGREKVPAALCRKIALAKLTNNPEVEIWGDGLQTRSFMYIDDCVKGIDKIMESDYDRPLNLGRNELISINELAYMIAKIAGMEIRLKHIKGPQGVRGRNSDNTRVQGVLSWSPPTSLEDGLKSTYEWIENEIKKRHV